MAIIGYCQNTSSGNSLVVVHDVHWHHGQRLRAAWSGPRELLTCVRIPALDSFRIVPVPTWVAGW